MKLCALVLMAIGFLTLQLFLDQGERNEWFDSWFIVALALVAAVALVSFFLRELTTVEPILDLSVYSDRNFAASSVIMLIMMVGFFSSSTVVSVFDDPMLPVGRRVVGSPLPQEEEVAAAA